MREITVLLSVIIGQLTLSGAAQIPVQVPPPAVITAAEGAFPEYSLGFPLDYAISTVDSPTQSISITQSFDPSPGGGVIGPRPTYPNHHIARMVVDSDFVGTGTTLKSWSYPTKKNNFVITIYLVHVRSVAVGDGGAITPERNIYVTRAGGQVNYKGYRVSATDPYFDLFPLDTSYLFFGAKVGPNLYKVNSDGSLQEANGQILETNKRNAYSALYKGLDTKSILSEAFEAWQSMPSKASKEPHE